jgi:asparagine synthase (glutamine-hydrolysing)
VIEEGTFWSLTARRSPLRLSPADSVDALEAVLSPAVEESLIADVPVGAYLSGGVDSSLTVALAARANKAQRLKTFSAGFPGSPDDETSYARRVSRLLGTEHHEVAVDPEDFFDDLQRLIWYRDLPISETSDVAVAALARLASQHVKVVISGEGSDELFAGYPKYRLARLTRAVGVVPGALREPVLSLARRTVGARRDRLATAIRAMEGRTEWDRIRGWFAPFSAAEVEALAGTPGRTVRPFVHLDGDAVRRLGLVDLSSWLADNLLERGDRMTMASSLELRPPFLDNRVVELGLAMPSSVKLHRGETKWPVKELAKRFVDADIVDRPKVGFRVPLSDWFRGKLEAPLRDLLTGSGSRVASWLDRPTIEAMVADHVAGRRDVGKQLWPLLSLELWARSLL